MTAADKIRVGVFCTSLPSRKRKPGGADVLAHRAADELARRGHDVTVVSYWPKPPGAAYEHEILKPRWLAERQLLRLLVLPWLWGRARPARFDVVHLHGDDWFFFRRGVATVRTFHGSALHEARTATSLKRRLSQYGVYAGERLAARLATACYAPSGSEGAVYGARGVLTCGVDLLAVPRARVDAAPAILFVGTWAGRKRGALLASAFAEVRAALPAVELWMVSDRVEPQAGIRWFENPDDATLAELYAAARVFCLPSAYEGLGIPYVEALATGLPVVATSNPGADWVLQNGAAGSIVPEELLAPTLIRLLSDPREWSRLSRAGTRRAADFSWDSVCIAYLRAYAGARDDYRIGRAVPSERR